MNWIRLLALVEFLFIVFLTYKLLRRSAEETAPVKLLSDVIKAVLKGETEELLKAVKRSLSFLPDDVYFYVLLGNMTRSTSPHKAFLIHRGLLFRRLTNDQEAEILLEIGRDFLLLGQKEKALESFKKSYRLSKSAEVLEELVSLAMELEMYDEAVDYRLLLNKLRNLSRGYGMKEILYPLLRKAYFSNDSSLFSRGVAWYKKYIGKDYLFELSSAILDYMRSPKKGEKRFKTLLKDYENERFTSLYHAIKVGISYSCDDFEEVAFLRDCSGGHSVPEGTVLSAFLSCKSHGLEREAGFFRRMGFIRCVSCKGVLKEGDFLVCSRCGDVLKVEPNTL